MKNVFAVMFFALFCSSVSAQKRESIELSSRWDNQRNGIIEVTHHDGGKHSVVMEFSNIENFPKVRFRRAEVYSTGQIVKLVPENRELNSSFAFRYIYVHGEVNPRRVDSAFVYRLPFGSSTSAEAIEMYSFQEMYNIKSSINTANHKAFQFTLNPADTVYAARKGLVLNVEDGHDPVTGMGEIAAHSESNEVFVEHADGSIARYSVLEKGSIAVKPGDTVYPDTPIALAGTYDGEFYQMRFALYYQTDNFNRINDLFDYSLTLHFIDPVFATPEGETTLTSGATHTPAVTEQLVTREMTRREIRDR